MEAPVNLNAMRRVLICVERENRRGYVRIIRIKPYDPSFRSTLARIIEPATGASTWALGSHR